MAATQAQFNNLRDTFYKNLFTYGVVYPIATGTTCIPSKNRNLPLINTVEEFENFCAMTSVSQESIIPYIPMLLNTSNIEVMIRMGMTLSFGMQLHNAATYIIDRWEKTIMYHIMKLFHLVPFKANVIGEASLAQVVEDVKNKASITRPICEELLYSTKDLSCKWTFLCNLSRKMPSKTISITRRSKKLPPLPSSTISTPSVKPSYTSSHESSRSKYDEKPRRRSRRDYESHIRKTHYSPTLERTRSDEYTEDKRTPRTTYFALHGKPVPAIIPNYDFVSDQSSDPRSKNYTGPVNNYFLRV